MSASTDGTQMAFTWVGLVQSLERIMGSCRFPGPQSRFSLFIEIDGGTLCRQASPLPGPLGGLSLWPEIYTPDFLPKAVGISDAITNDDKAEFAIIKKMPVYDHKRRAYGNVSSYVLDRTRYFGPPNAYAKFSAESDTELANTKWVGKKRTRTLRSMLEFGKESQAQQQQIFYRWVRKAYKLKYGDSVSVPELIRKGMSQELADKIAEVRGSIRVKKIHDEQFKAGGFNPRPVKYNHHYLLGTLSEHATGMAVDIDDTQNAQFTIEEWAFIESLAGKHVVRSGRWTTEAAAEGLWHDIKNVNDLFLAKVALEVQRIGKERAEKEKKEKAESNPATSESAKSQKPKPILEEILGKHFKSLSPWVPNGFFHLPLELVLELHAHGFDWGAAFGTNVDLHHFELPE